MTCCAVSSSFPARRETGIGKRGKSGGKDQLVKFSFDTFNIFNFLITTGVLLIGALVVLATLKRQYFELLKNTSEGYKAAAELKTSEVVELKISVMGIRDDVKSLRKENDNLRIENATLVTLNVRLQEDNSRLREENVHLQREVYELRGIVSFLERSQTRRVTDVTSGNDVKQTTITTTEIHPEDKKL